MLGADAQAIRAEHFGDLHHRPGLFEAEIADDDVGFIDEHARAPAQLREADPRIDVAVVIRSADDDLRGLARRAAEKSADAIRGRGHLLDDLLQLLDRLARVADHLLLRFDFRAQQSEPFARHFRRSGRARPRDRTPRAG